VKQISLSRSERPPDFIECIYMYITVERLCRPSAGVKNFGIRSFWHGFDETPENLSLALWRRELPGIQTYGH